MKQVIKIEETTDVIEAIDRRIIALAKARDEIDSEVEVLRKAKEMLAGTPKRPTRRRRKPTTASTNGKDAAKIAGPAAIEAVKGALGDGEGHTQAEIARATEKNSGTVSYAIKALVERGEVERDGRIVRLKRRVAPPSS
jgi:MarR family